MGVAADVHSWLARYETQGLEGLVDRSHRPVRVRIRWRLPRCSCVVRGRIGVRGGWCSSRLTAVWRRCVGAGGLSSAVAGRDDRPQFARPALAQVETRGTRRRRWSCGRREFYGPTRRGKRLTTGPGGGGPPREPVGHNPEAWRRVPAIEGVRLHGLCNSVAAQLISREANFMQVSKRLGHSTFTLTRDVYGIGLPQQRRSRFPAVAVTRCLMG